METTNVSTLKIHRLTENQYKRELEAGRIDETAIYLTPEVEYQDLGEITDYDDVDDFVGTLLEQGKYRFTLGDYDFFLTVKRLYDDTVDQFMWNRDSGIEYLNYRWGYIDGFGEWRFGSWEPVFYDAIRYNSQSLTDSQKSQARKNISAAPDFSTKPITATSTDGITYTATVDGLSELYVGCSLMIIPNMTSTSSSAVTLNVNNLGAVSIKRWDNISTSEWWGFPIAGWMKAGYPIRVKYTGVYWIIEGMSKTYATDLTGTVSIANGGTDATTAEAARSNLGVAPMYSYSTTDITAGTSALTTGQMHLVYE